MLLRDYQQQAITDINAAWETHRNAALVLTCRAGKTPTFCHIIKHNIGASVALAHRAELVGQMSRTLAKYDVYHRIIGPDSLRKECGRAHLREFGKNYTDSNSQVAVASVDTLIRMDEKLPWFKSVTLWVVDEMHHITAHEIDLADGRTIKGNKWGKAINMFPNAKGLGVTATPCRGDGKGLSIEDDGVFDVMVQGPPMRELEARGFIAPYKIYAPSSDIDLTDVSIGSGGEYVSTALAKAVHKSHITGDVVEHYQRLIPGKMAMVFSVDVEAATAQAQGFNEAGITAVVVSANTPTLERIELQRQFTAGTLKVIVNVDLYGEGVDVPALDAVIMARPTQSFPLFFQQFNRPLTYQPGKTGIIIDHVGNVARHSGAWMRYVVRGEWSLYRQDTRRRTAQTDVIQVRTCGNCLAVYERIIGPQCPYCDHITPPFSRSAPEYVDGDLQELSFETLAALRGLVAHNEQLPRPPYNAAPVIVASIAKNHRLKLDALGNLRSTMSEWAAGKTDMPRAQREFWLTFGIDVMTAQTLNRTELIELTERIENERK